MGENDSAPHVVKQLAGTVARLAGAVAAAVGLDKGKSDLMETATRLSEAEQILQRLHEHLKGAPWTPPAGTR